MRRPALGLVALFFLVVLLTAISLFTGPVGIAPAGVVSALLHPGVADPDVVQIITELRVPHAFAAVFAGASLGLSGLVLQSVFRNPLAGPSVLGVNAGAGLGAALVLLVGGGASSFGIVPAAALGAFGVIAVILFCSKFLESPVSLLIVGIMLGYFVDAAVSVLITVSDAESLRGYVLWGMGSLSRLTLPDAPRFAAVLAAGFLCIVPCVRYLNAARLGDDFAASLGLPVRRYRFLALCGAAVLAAGTVVYCGPVGFLGFAVPHLAYAVFRTSNHRVLIPACMLTGAVLALLAGFIPGVPLNAVMSLVGVPAMLWVLLAGRRRAGGFLG